MTTCGKRPKHLGKKCVRISQNIYRHLMTAHHVVALLQLSRRLGKFRKRLNNLLLWEQDAAGSNPVSPMRQKVSIQLTSLPPSRGYFSYSGLPWVVHKCICKPESTASHLEQCVTQIISLRPDLILALAETSPKISSDRRPALTPTKNTVSMTS